MPPPSAADYLLPVEVESGTWGAVMPFQDVGVPVCLPPPVYLRLTPYDQRFLSRIGVKFRP